MELKGKRSQRPLVFRRFIPLLFWLISSPSAFAWDPEFELRAGYGIANAQGGAISSGAPGQAANAMGGWVFTGLLTSPDSWVDFGLQYEELRNSTPAGGNYNVLFRRFGLVLEKEIHWGAFWFGPVVEFNFLNIARFTDGSGTEFFRANDLGYSLGGALGARFHGFGLALELGYRSARLTNLIDSSSGAWAPPTATGGPPDFSGFFASLSAAFWL